MNAACSELRYRLPLLCFGAEETIGGAGSGPAESPELTALKQQALAPLIVREIFHIIEELKRRGA